MDMGRCPLCSCPWAITRESSPHICFSSPVLRSLAPESPSLKQSGHEVVLYSFLTLNRRQARSWAWVGVGRWEGPRLEPAWPLPRCRTPQQCPSYPMRPSRPRRLVGTLRAPGRGVLCTPEHHCLTALRPLTDGIGGMGYAESADGLFLQSMRMCVSEPSQLPGPTPHCLAELWLHGSLAGRPSNGAC